MLFPSHQWSRSQMGSPTWDLTLVANQPDAPRAACISFRNSEGNHTMRRCDFWWNQEASVKQEKILKRHHQERRRSFFLSGIIQRCMWGCRNEPKKSRIFKLKWTIAIGFGGPSSLRHTQIHIDPLSPRRSSCSRHSGGWNINWTIWWKKSRIDETPKQWDDIETICNFMQLHFAHQEYAEYVYTLHQIEPVHKNS